MHDRKSSSNISWPIRLLLALACLMAAAPATAEDFYKGKTITLLVGSAEGGGYDQYARLLARHMGKYIAGDPAIVVKNQPAAGGMAMANAMYATVARDGLTIGMMARDNPLEPLLGNAAAKFRPESFAWLGTSSRYDDDAFCLVIRAETGVTGIADLQRPGRPLIFGGQAAGGSETDIVLIAREVFKLNIQFIRGYRSSTDTLLALRRGEIEGRAITTSTLQKSMADWLDRGMLRYLMQFGHATRWKGLPDVPTARELAPTPDDKALLELAETPFLMSRPFFAPPGIAPAQCAILTQAFMQAHQDADYLREAREMQLDVSPVGGDEMQKLMSRIAETPAAVIARYKAAVSTN
jgi:tripartite-type tricarboxylate transporter receptor subunit TctC